MMQILGVAMAVALAFGLVVLVTQTIENDAAALTRLEALSSMTRVGEVAKGNTTVSFWAFDFEGKRCLYAVHGAYRSGLTCWEKTP